MSRVLVLHAHPHPTQSNVNVRMSRVAGDLEDVTPIDLYALYPRHDIDIEAEQERLLEHDVLVLQFPFHWYSAPSIIKLWIDVVLEFGFAYGEGGTLLAGKSLLIATTAGGAEEAYGPDGSNRFPIRTLLTPFEQTADLCRMRYLAPFVLFAALRAAGDGAADAHVERYRALLAALAADEIDLEAAAARELMLETPELPSIGRDPADRGPTDRGPAATDAGER